MFSGSHTEQYHSEGERWQALAVKAQQGDKRAYAELLGAIYPFVKGRVSSGLANPDWVDDVAQDVLVSVHKSLDTYSYDRPFRPWLMAIINFRKTDFLRRHYKNRKVNESSLEKSEIFLTHVTNINNIGELKDIEKALSSVSDKQRKIFILMKIEGYTAQEVAREMGMSESAVKVSAHRTGLKLKEMLDPDA